MPISNDSYEEAWQKLLYRYDNKKQIVQSLIKTFLDQKPISEANCFNLRKLFDMSDECLRGLNALGEQASSKDCWLIYLLLQKIDPESKRLWAIKSSEEEFPNMKAFLDFLNVRCSSLELMLNNESECKIPIRTIEEHFVGFIAFAETTGEYITDSILQELERNGLDIENCRGQGYDNDANRVGINKGVRTRILNRNPRTFFTPCGRHSWNLLLVDAANSSAKTKTFFGFINKI
ncbi:zinc finger MYM-type protein 1 [Trichonephila clavipes]|nr:zinc finger MYM-type protein 1 [Trichonephila clavipes]